MSECKVEWMSGWVSKWVSDSVPEWLSERVSDCVSGCLGDLMNASGWLSKGWKGKWASGRWLTVWVGDFKGEYVSKWFIERRREKSS